jgi:hypothetical protein
VEITGKVRARRRVEFLAQASAVLLESVGAVDALVLQRQLWRVAAAPVVADAGLVLAASAPA